MATLRRCLALTSLLLLFALALSGTAAAGSWVHGPGEFRAWAPAGFSLRYQPADGSYLLTSRVPRAQLRYRLLRTRATPAAVARRFAASRHSIAAGTSTRTRAAGPGRVVLTTWTASRPSPSLRRALGHIARTARGGRAARRSQAAALGAGRQRRPILNGWRRSPAWRADFDAAGGVCDFAGAGWDGYGGIGYPQCGDVVGIMPPETAGVPPLAGHARVARLGGRASDAEAGPVMAKLMRSFYARGFDEAHQDLHHTRPPSNVSGSYQAWFYLPEDFQIAGSGWRNIMQFKERYWDGSQSGYQSDPAWWLVLYNGDGRGTPYAHVNYWNGGNAGTAGASVEFPRGRWVEVRAELYEGDRIEWFLDGRRIAVGANSQYPVGPFHGTRSLAWDFGVGNYAGSGVGPWQNRLSAPLYVGAADLHRAR